MPAQSFTHVRHWVFDLDNTLYAPSVRLFDQIQVKMTAWVMREIGVTQAEADTLREHYWRAHGTTLAGLMAEHAIDPEDFMKDVHCIDFGVLTKDEVLASHIRALPGRRIVYTNASAPYAEQVLAARGLSGCFDAIYGVEHAGWRPKPQREAFESIFALDGTDPALAAMFEDDTRNLTAPHAMGMRTVHVAPEAAPAAHIQFHTGDLTAFLGQLLR